MKTTSQEKTVPLSNFTKNRITQPQSITGGAKLAKDKVRRPGQQG